ncbi:leucine-rich repeat-containing G-protein coupled receptor 4-like [Daphnia pulicaria]|uniref:leucine-rich repeat-containing G-protein coupled receptor 4-like n=1 Tax=Daphnia pulicaria TaxID=35523 RepID=UPI001EEC204B|nr:leucine-rich repeat-containing G-protein coupled receptor 4-like [Daphnia pulicaria]
MRSGRPAIITRLLGLRLVRLRPIPPLDIMKSLAACTLFVLASSVCCVSAANTTDTTAGSTNGTRAAGPTSPDTTTTTTTLHYCPLTCFCDFDSSLVSCAGTDDDDVVWVNRSSSNNNNNNTAAIPSDVWSVVSATKIQRLDVRDLVLERLDYSHLNGTERLSELSLVRCGLAAIGAGTFARHSNLERLDLSQNQLTILSQNMLTGLIRLRSLDLSSNKLTLIDGALETLITLEQLNLRGNALAVLGPDIFKGVSRLQFLNVDGNHIGAIAESAFQGLGQLAHLILSCNPLGEIQHVDLFAARPAYVDMSSAGLRSVPSLIARYVRDLRLSGNNFSRLHRGDFESVPQVRLLLLDDSHIVDIEEDALGRMDLLEELSLNGNQLGNVPVSLPSTSLSSLHLEGNRITALRAADFIGLRRLDQLHLARNVIVSIATGTFHQLTSLTRLDLRSNRLSHVSSDVFGSLVRLRFLDLSDNPLVIPGADAERLRHLTAVVKVIIATVPDQPKIDERSMVAKVTQVLDASETSTSTIPDSAMRFSHNGPNEASESTDGEEEVAAAGKSPQQALALVGALLSLSVLIVVLFIIADRFMKRSHRGKTTAVWNRRGVAGVDGATTHLPQKDVVKLGWIPAEDFDHWSTVLIQNDTEHERLLLAVSPHQ